ncbi:hypothetical protein [Dehalobacter restrictus]|uniref:Uncharacterized protein n=1 Tax=Dehalobacter restrictus TaxID=55583 RepID=A0A857DJ87_9FIRM|nr:hypothetical protein [Dehalobacter restrictus]QHA00529.1 hypothetical protein GQ588_07745 [Dehalobacter restrictus]
MGIRQFSASLADFNQQQLDTIGFAVDEINVIVDDLKNTDIADLSISIANLRTLASGTFFNTAGTTPSHLSTMTLDVTGAGYLSFVYAGVSSVPFVVQVDGGSKYYLNAIYGMSCLIPFSASIKVTTNSGISGLGYVLF